MASRRRVRLTDSDQEDLALFLIRHYFTPSMVEWAVEHNFTIEDERVRKAATEFQRKVELYIRLWPKKYVTDEERELLSELKELRSYKELTPDDELRLSELEEAETIIKSNARKRAALDVEDQLVLQAKRANAEEEDLYNFLRLTS